MQLHVVEENTLEFLKIEIIWGSVMILLKV